MDPLSVVTQLKPFKTCSALLALLARNSHATENVLLPVLQRGQDEEIQTRVTVEVYSG